MFFVFEENSWKRFITVAASASFPDQREIVPRLRHLLLQEDLSRSDPRRIVLLRYARAVVPEQNRDALQGHSPQQQFDRKCVAESVWRPLEHASLDENSIQLATPDLGGNVDVV